MDADEAKGLGASLRRIDSKVLRPVHSGCTPVWYRGGESYFDLFFELEADGALAWFQLTLRGRAVTWEEGRLWTGSTHETEVQPDFPVAKTVVADRRVDRALVADAAQILAARPEEAPLVLARERLASFLG